MTEMNIKIDSDDLFEIFGWLDLLSKGVQLPKEITSKLTLELIDNIVKANIESKDFLQAIVKANIESKDFLQAVYGQSR